MYDVQRIMKKGFLMVLSFSAISLCAACSSPAQGSTRENSISAERKSIPEGRVTAVNLSSQPGLPQKDSTAFSRKEEISGQAKGQGSRILIAYFSRWGNTEYPNGVDASSSASIVVDNGRFGTTEYVARMIQEGVGGDLHLIKTKEPYTTDFNELRDVNHKEAAQGYLPYLEESGLDLSQYDTVFIGYPVWAMDVPQAVRSFLKEYDLSGKKVIPFCTHDGYGAGSSYDTIREESHGTDVREGLAIEADDVVLARAMVTDWLKTLGIREETPITITVGEYVLEGVLYDTALAREIKEQFPLTISMSGYGGREYYGGVDFYPENLEGGQRNFENGDITYCEAHHNMAIFYAQTDNPVLSVDVIPVGRVTSELGIFETLEGREQITFSLAE